MARAGRLPSAGIADNPRIVSIVGADAARALEEQSFNSVLEDYFLPNVAGTKE